MNAEEYLISRYDNALMLLPPNMRMNARKLKREDRKRVEEIRLRHGKKPTVLINGKETEVQDEAVTYQDILSVIETATRASFHTHSDAIKRGYITAPGGYRIGICGTVRNEGGANFGYSSFSSLNIRISRETFGCSDEIVFRLISNEAFASTLILSPPGFGKTTLLRDLIRNLSDGVPEKGISSHRVSVCDERSEIAGGFENGLQMILGSHTDILEGCAKADGIMMLLRSMNPQIIALDEITSAEDIDAIEMASYCGVSFLATAHAFSEEDLFSRPLYRKLLSLGVFKNFVFINRAGTEREYVLKTAEDIYA